MSICSEGARVMRMIFTIFCSKYVSTYINITQCAQETNASWEISSTSILK